MYSAAKGPNENRDKDKVGNIRAAETFPDIKLIFNKCFGATMTFKIIVGI